MAGTESRGDKFLRSDLEAADLKLSSDRGTMTAACFSLSLFSIDIESRKESYPGVAQGAAQAMLIQLELETEPSDLVLKLESRDEFH